MTQERIEGVANYFVAKPLAWIVYGIWLALVYSWLGAAWCVNQGARAMDRMAGETCDRRQAAGGRKLGADSLRGGAACGSRRNAACGSYRGAGHRADETCEQTRSPAQRVNSEWERQRPASCVRLARPFF